ncbi:DUF502 domain-containing protein [Saccharospirillum salsuginis]|uniref:DUF502 domain-containing protein n=1 Tax=Saccharospirillum salsuginis TaxID=418750 RepID=A0A918JZU8_9GAMM|nr:DUF502 domain-containing protein [Saccharospirillum salsuginis]GGX38595.1 hypothetical protein GCM10007392_00990 [Saccharospirillum salsuginis]
MKRTLWRGILTITPLVISVWLFWSIAITLDNLGQTVLSLVGVHNPWGGTGFLLILIAVLVVGLALSVRPFQWFFRRLEEQVMRFPLIKTVYGAVKDMASLISQGEGKSKARQTVLVRQANDNYVVGFITSETLPRPLADALPGDEGEDWVPVLFQVSYQIAGMTVLVRRSDLIEVDWSFDEALKFMVTAGIARGVEPGKLGQRLGSTTP